MHPPPNTTLQPTSPSERWRILLLGANAAWFGVYWPLLATRQAGSAAVWLALLCPLPLLLGVFGEKASPQLRSAALLVAFPALVIAAVAFRSEDANQQALPLPLLVLLWLSLCAYGALAACTYAPRAVDMPTTITALGQSPWRHRLSASTWLQRGFTSLCFAGAFALVFIAPTFSAPSADSDRATADAAAVLAAVVGTALAITTVTVFLGNALREIPRPARPGAPLRIVRYIFLALLGALTYAVIRR